MAKTMCQGLPNVGVICIAPMVSTNIGSFIRAAMWIAKGCLLNGAAPSDLNNKEV